MGVFSALDDKKYQGQLTQKNISAVIQSIKNRKTVTFNNLKQKRTQTGFDVRVPETPEENNKHKGTGFEDIFGLEDEKANGSQDELGEYDGYNFDDDAIH